MKPMTFVCSPYPDKGEYWQYARDLIELAIKNGHIPIAPQLCGFEEHKAADKPIDLLGICDSILVGDEYGISKEMETQLRYAKWAGLRKIYEREMKGA